MHSSPQYQSIPPSDAAGIDPGGEVEGAGWKWIRNNANDNILLRNPSRAYH